MSTSPTQIRIDENVKRQASELFSNLGLDMSSAVNMFLRQCILRQGLPFMIEMPRYSEETIVAMEEAKELSKYNNAKKYQNFKEVLEEIDG